MQVKVKNFPGLKEYISQNISSNFWNSIQGPPGGGGSGIPKYLK